MGFVTALVMGSGAGFCLVDGVPLPSRASGPPASYCSARCRMAAMRARRAAKTSARRPTPIPVRPIGPSNASRWMAAPRERLPAPRRELVPGRSAAGRLTGTGGLAALSMVLAAGGYEIDPEARRGMCIIVEILGRYEERACQSPAHPDFPGFCAHHVSVLKRLA